MYLKRKKIKNTVSRITKNNYTKEKQPLFPVEREMHLAIPMSLNGDFSKPWFVSDHPFIHLLYGCQNEFALKFIDQKGRISMQPTFIASSFMTMLSVNCLNRVYPLPLWGPVGMVIMKGSERFNYNLIYYRNRFMVKLMWIIVNLKSNKLYSYLVNIREYTLILQDIAILWCFVQWFFNAHDKLISKQKVKQNKEYGVWISH